VPSARGSVVAAAGFVIAVAVLSQVLSAPNIATAAKGLSVALIMLSLVLLTGYGGQVSLCQYTFVGLGAFVFGKVAADGSPLGLIAAAAVTAIIGAVVALPALRLQGLYLALSTLAFAVLAYFLFFLDRRVLARQSLLVARLHFPGVSFASNKANLILLAIAFALMGMMVLAIRRGPFGRLLGAMSDSPAACATLGLSLTTTKLAVFSLSAAMAGVAGALFAGARGSIQSNDVLYIPSLVLLLLVTIGGINTVTGAFLGGMFLAMFDVINPHLPAQLQQLTLLGTGFGAMMLGRNPNGLAGMLADLVDRLRAPRPGRRPAATDFLPQEVDVAASLG
jgi:branched-chain amino acid transport system permease protein